MQFKTRLLFLFAWALSVSAPILAQQSSDDIIDNVVEAYGGKAFKRLKSMRVSDQYIGFRYGQSYSATEVNRVNYRSSVLVDFKKQRIDFNWVRGDKAHFSTMHQLFDGKDGYSIDHTQQTLSKNPSLRFHNTERRHLYYLDTAIAKLLYQSRETADYLGQKHVQGELKHVLRFKADKYPAMTVYIDAEKYHITQMLRAHWRLGEYYVYNYATFNKQENVTFAQESYVTRGGNPYNITVDRKVAFNVPLQDEFQIPKHYEKEPDSLSFNEMTVQTIGENLYLAGQEWGFSIFFDAGDYFIGSGSYEQLTERFNAVQNHINAEKPLKYQIITHHHLDHLGGMNEVFELGAQFVTVKDNIEIIRETAEQVIPKHRFVLVDKHLSLADGKVQITDFPNRHTNHNLISFFSEQKTIFSADLFISRAKEGAPRGYEGLKDFKAMLKESKYDAKLFAASHSGRLLTDVDLDTAIDNIKDTVCPENWTICP